MLQIWRDLFFFHRECDPDEIQKTLPKGLYVDTFDKKAYIGIVPFKVPLLRPIPFFPGFSFLEINLRTYVFDKKGKQGIWFYSLDTNHRFAAFGARKTFHLPYIYSKIDLFEDDCYFHYFLIRNNLQDDFFLQRKNVLFKAPFKSLESFLIERYFLFSEKEGNIYSMQISHKPYDLSMAVEQNHSNHNLFTIFHTTKKTDIPIYYSPGVNVVTNPLMQEYYD